MKALVLAAGKGKRLKIFTKERPKALIGIVGEPVLGHIIRKTLACGIMDMIFVVGYGAKMVIDYIRREAESKGFRAGIVEQRDQLGTGDATTLAKEEIGGETFLLLYGDLYFGEDVLPLVLKAHRRQGLDNLMTLVEAADVAGFGEVKVDNGRVKGIIEKPKVGGKGLINAGIYVLSPGIFEELEELERSIRGEYEITDAINRLAKARGVGYVKAPKNSWVDIGRPWDVLDANMIELRKRKAHAPEGGPIVQPSFIGMDVKLERRCAIGPYAVLEDGATVGEGSRIDHSVVMEGGVVGADSVISHSIIGHKASVGSGTRTKTAHSYPLRIELEGRIYDLGSRRLGAMIGSKTHVTSRQVLEPGQIIS
ncbi:MAG: sugar phosphate nucleotidyltransferase [Candidatus Geothermarchaeales archaeon]